MDPKVGDLLQVEPGGTVIRPDLEGMPESGFRIFKVVSLKALERPSEGIAPGLCRLRLVAPSQEVMHLDQFLKSLEAEFSRRTADDLITASFERFAGDQNVSAEIFVQTFKTGREIHVFADRRVVNACRAAEVTDVGKS